MKLALCYRSLCHAGQENFAIHAAGCAHILSHEVQKNDATIEEVEVASTDAAVEILLDGLPEGYSKQNIEIFPCCKNGPVAAKPLPEGACAGTGKPFKIDPMVGGGRRLYCPCSVCGKYLGTARGVAPRHKPYK